MQNDMRDRLIELIRQSHCVDVWDYWNDELKQPNPIETLADHLITNGVIVPPCKMVILPCNLGDTAYCINGYEHKYIEKFTVEKIVISDEGLVLIDTSGCEWLAKVCYFSLESAEKALKEPVPKASAHNSFFYNRFMKTV
ncbi:MAG: hypothetical protein ACI4SX_03895 [Candidatus Fimenecus sp.]